MIGALLLALLVAHFAAHVALVVALRKKIPPLQAALAFFVSPLAPYWAFRNGLSRRAWVWLGTLAVYACAISVIRGCV